MKIAWTGAALADLEAAHAFISERTPRNAAAVIKRLEQALQSLRSHPEMGRPGRVEGTRELVLLRTPFIIPYRIREDTIEILAFLHGARKWPKGLDRDACSCRV